MQINFEKKNSCASFKIPHFCLLIRYELNDEIVKRCFDNHF